MLKLNQIIKNYAKNSYEKTLVIALDRDYEFTQIKKLSTEKKRFTPIILHKK